MAKVTVLDFSKVDISASGLQIVKPPALSFKVEVELDKKMDKEAAKDPLLQQEFKDAGRDILDKTVKMVEDKMKIFDKLFVGMRDKGVDQKEVDKHLKGLNDAVKNDLKVAEKMAEEAVMKAWTDLQGKRKEWKMFKIKVGAKIAGTLAGLAVSIAAMASAPFSGGAGAAFGIIGLIKSGVTLATEISKVAMDIDKAKTLLETNLAVVEKTAKSTGIYVANEVTAAVLDNFLGISQPNIKTCQGSADVLKAKYAQIVVKVHDLSKTLDKILGEQKKLEKEFLADAAKKASKDPRLKTDLSKLQKNLDAYLAPNFKEVEKSIAKVHKLYEDTKKWAPDVATLTKRVKDLEVKDPKALKVFREVLPVLMLATAPLDGNKIATTAKDLGMGLGGAVGGYAYDKITAKAIDGTAFDI